MLRFGRRLLNAHSGATGGQDLATLMQRRIAALETQNAGLKTDLDKLHKQVLDLTRQSSTLKDVSFYAGCQPTQLGLSTIADYCTMPQYSTHVFCHRELPIRFAQQVQTLDSLPHGLSMMPSVLKTKQLYLESFDDVRNAHVPESSSQQRSFTKLLRKVEERVQDVLMTMAHGLIEFKVHIVRHKVKLTSPSERMQFAHELLMTEYPNVQTALDMFFECMIGINFLLRQHIALEQQRELPQDERDPKEVGVISYSPDILRVVRSAVDAGREICTQHFGDSPDVKIIHKPPSDGSPLLDVAHIPSNIFYIVTELMKNSLRAVVETSVRNNPSAHTTPSGLVDCMDMPEVLVTVLQDHNASGDVVVMVRDRGGGFRRSVEPRVMSYMYTTAEAMLTPAGVPSTGGSPLAGYGYGLPVSRLYARHFGGELEVTSVEGYGTDALLYIPNSVGDTEKPTA
eukprot:PhM_4_TR16487/c0_g1_i1/m.77295/K00898/PDK2_3_4; pyruvate dehydrogenase kinase 2/3/4